MTQLDGNLANDGASASDAPACEWQFDGLIGPTHNYAGLAVGNMASHNNAGAASNPREAALQGLEKMWFVKNLGMNQAFLPPQSRPLWGALRALGFGGNKAKMLEDAYKTAPHLLAACYSASSMWVANAATIAPSADSADGKLHITPANLTSHLHRALEVPQTQQLLQQIFHDKAYFTVHDALPNTPDFSDEGAANHMRVCAKYGAKGLHIFVYGAAHNATQRPQQFKARQRREAFEAIARNHQLDAASCLFVQQHPQAIDAGVFHHDVIGMNTTRVMIHHEKALLKTDAFIAALQEKAQPYGLDYIEISDNELSLQDAVNSYFFNSQLIELSDKKLVIIAPSECAQNPAAHRTLTKLASGNGPIDRVHYLDVRQSMRNGGGPACLRLRIVMNAAQSAAMHQGVVLTKIRYEQLKSWINTHYRDRLQIDDLRDAAFAKELEAAYQALDAITGLQPIS
jgi:succinylarginine dihydrolase